MRRWGAAAGALAVAMLASAASAQDFKPDQVVRGHIEIGGKQVPLPEGDWRIAGFGYSAIRDSTFSNLGAFGAVENVVAVRRNGDTVDAFIEINTNSLSIIDGWGLSKDCLRTDIYLTVTRYSTGFDGSCLFVKRTVTGTANGSLRAWTATKTFAAANRLELPPAWITAGFRYADRQDIVDVRVHFNPATRGLGSAAPTEDPLTDPWAAEPVKADKRKMRFLEELSFWGIFVSGYFEKGLRNRLTAADVMPMPSAELLDRTRPDVEERIAWLERFRSEGALSPEEFDRQRKIALAEGTSAQSADWFSHSLKKNLSFRVFGSIVDWILAFGVTLSAPLSTGITASIVAIHSVIFVFNDRYWDNYWKDNGRRDGSQTVDFIYVGDDPAPKMVAANVRP